MKRACKATLLTVTALVFLAFAPGCMLSSISIADGLLKMEAKLQTGNE